MLKTVYVTFDVQIEIPEEIQEDVEEVVDMVVGDMDYNLSFNDGEGVKIIHAVVECYQDECPG